jgi:hypothetical protein
MLIALNINYFLIFLKILNSGTNSNKGSKELLKILTSGDSDVLIFLNPGYSG